MDAILGEIRLFGGSFAPVGWALCDGKLMSVSSNSALYSVLGTTYGGDGKSTFALPDLRGCMVVGAEESEYTLGKKAGSREFSLMTEHLPPHTHEVVSAKAYAYHKTGQTKNASQNMLPSGYDYYYSQNAPSVAMAPGSIKAEAKYPLSGNRRERKDYQPYLAVTYIICVEGGITPEPLT